MTARRSFRLHFNQKRRDSVPSANAIGLLKKRDQRLKKEDCNQKIIIRAPENVTAVGASLI